MLTMRAWSTTGVAGGLELSEHPVPEPGDDEVLIRVDVCGICRTDLHVIDHEIPVHLPLVTPGHEAVGRVAAPGPGVTGFGQGDRVGVAWLRRTCGECDFCRRGAENLWLSRAPARTRSTRRLPRHLRFRVERTRHRATSDGSRRARVRDDARRAEPCTGA